MDSQLPPTHHHTRRWLSLLIAVSLTGTACGVPTGQNGIVDSFPNVPITLEIWRPYNEAGAYLASSQFYHDRHPNVTVNYQYKNPATFEAELIDALANGTGPDIVALDNDRMPAFIDKLVPMPVAFFVGSDLTANITARYAPAVATDTIFDGKVYGIPFSTDSLALYFNRGMAREVFQDLIREGREFRQDLLVRAPADWDEVVETTKLITQRSGETINRAGIALGVSANVPRTPDIIAAMFLQRGIQMTSSDRRSATFHLASPADPNAYPAATVLEYLKGFVDPSSSYYTWNTSLPNALDAFIEGKLAMLIHHQGAAPYIRQRNPQIEFITAPFPQIPNARAIVDYAIYPVEAVTNNAEYPEVAWDFLSFINQFGLTEYTQSTGRTIPQRGVPATTTVLERYFLTSAFSVQLPTAYSWFKGPNADQVDRQFAQALDRVSQENKDPKESLNQAAAAVSQLLVGP